MISVEVKSYRLMLVAAIETPAGSAEATWPAIFLYDAADRFFARINFPDDADLHGVSGDPTNALSLFVLSFPRSDYPAVVDLLRHEKPVFLHVSGANPVAAVLSTSAEPAGESEAPA